MLHHHGVTFHRRERALPEAGYFGADAVRRSKVHNDDMIVGVVDDLIERRRHFRVAPCRESALENRKLQPLAVAFHELEYGAPSLRVANVVGDDVQVLAVAHDSPRGEIRVAGDFSAEKTPEQARLQLKQASVAQPVAEGGMGDLLRESRFKTCDETLAPIGGQVDAVTGGDKVRRMD